MLKILKSKLNAILKACLSFVISIVFFYSCSKDKIDAPDAIKALIAKYTNCECEPFIDEYTWRREIVYLSACGGALCNCKTLYYDKDGTEFQMDSGYTPDNFRQEATLLKHTWTCK